MMGVDERRSSSSLKSRISPHVEIGAVGSPGDGEDGGFTDRLHLSSTLISSNGPRKTSVQTQTVTDDIYFQKKITPSVPKRCKIGVYLATGTLIIIEPEKGSSVTAGELLQSIVESEQLALPPIATEIFSIWMASPFLEVQLKSGHEVWGVRKGWKRLLSSYSSCSEEEGESDEPRLVLRRSLHLGRREERGIKELKVLELLYAEARHNILSGRYPTETEDYSTLGALQAGIELGSYNSETHTLDFFRQNQRQFLPEHVCEPSWIPSFILGKKKNSPPLLVLENFRRIPPTTPSRKLVRKYLELCWTLPYYGSAMFHGQVESPAKGLWSFLDHPDNFVLVAINNHSLHVIDYYRNRILIGASFESFKVELGWPAVEGSPNCFPCLFLQFTDSGSESPCSRLFQIFSKQAPLMDALISTFIRGTRNNRPSSTLHTPMDSLSSSENLDIQGDFLGSLLTVAHGGDETSCLSNKLSELSLAAFDENGACISQPGSWAFSN